jgi:ABC-type Zn uptake system ZnuABC Zn-binding protein ZnuA
MAQHFKQLGRRQQKPPMHLGPTALALFFGLLILAACTQPPGQETSQDNKLNIVATTTIVGDVVRQIGGDAIELTVVLPLGSDPHSFEPTPQDIAKVAKADVIFANGAGLEEFLDPLIESAGAGYKVVNLSEDIELIQNITGQETEQEGNNRDPHVWTDPNNVIVWTQAITDALSELDPDNAEAYLANAQEYQEELIELDAWIREQVAQLPAGNREIITDHLILAYFADEYGLTQRGAIIPGYSTLAEPSAQELAKLVDTIRELNVPAIFVGNTINPTMAKRLTEDTGTQLVLLYTGSLSEQGGEADNYIAYTKYNVYAIVNALK